MDSDRDNSTNGEELGDPNCVWFEGQTPSGTPKSHPGKHTHGNINVTYVNGLRTILFLIINY